MLCNCQIIVKSVVGSVVVADAATAAVQMPSLGSADFAIDIGAVLGSLLPGIFFFFFFVFFV